MSSSEEKPCRSTVSSSWPAQGAAVLGLPATAAAEETVCDGTMVDATVDNLRVPDGATCVLHRGPPRGHLRLRVPAVMRHLDGLPPGAQARLADVRERRVLAPVTEEEGTASLVDALALTSSERSAATLRERDLSQGGAS